jgi:hypothetical protein
MNIQYKGKDYKIPEPFTKCYFGADPAKEMTIHNRFSDETFQQSARIPAFAVAIYDTIIGAEASEDWNLMNKGREWFQKNFVDAILYIRLSPRFVSVYGTIKRDAN